MKDLAGSATEYTGLPDDKRRSETLPDPTDLASPLVGAARTARFAMTEIETRRVMPGRPTIGIIRTRPKEAVEAAVILGVGELLEDAEEATSSEILKILTMIAGATMATRAHQQGTKSTPWPTTSTPGQDWKLAKAFGPQRKRRVKLHRQVHENSGSFKITASPGGNPRIRFVSLPTSTKEACNDRDFSCLSTTQPSSSS